MLLTLMTSIVDELSPVAQATGLDADIDIGRGDGAVNRISVTVPDESWAVPLIRGCGGAIYKEQDLVYVDGWSDVCEMLQRIPWFVPIGRKGTDVQRPSWTPPSDDELPEPAGSEEMNAFLCAWIFVSGVQKAVRAQFVDGDADEREESALTHPEVSDEIAYRLYARAVRAWCRCFALPHRLIAAAEYLTHGWRPEMSTWLESLRPDVVCDVVRDPDGVLSCRLTAPRAVHLLLGRALLTLGNLIVDASREYVGVLKIIPDVAPRVMIPQTSPHTAMHAIFTAALSDLGFATSFEREAGDAKQILTLHSYGQPYFTISGPTPVEDGHLAAMRNAVRKGEEYV